MIQIIHVSDTHAQGETMSRIKALAHKYRYAEVFAFTGDGTSQSTSRVPSCWNEFPQKLKLAVPGNHDDPLAYETLAEWVHLTPWCELYKDLLFVGIDRISPMTLRPGRIAYPDTANALGLVLLIHELDSPRRPLVEKLQCELNKKSVPTLVLFGHDHPREFSGSEWTEETTSSGSPLFLSRVCSSMSRRRGLAHLVTWDGGRFSCKGSSGGRTLDPSLTSRWIGPGMLSDILP